MGVPSGRILIGVMSDFVQHKTVADRAASDRRRHRQKIEDAIKKGVSDVIADESIIGQDGKKKIRVPVKGIKEYRFVYGQNEKNERVGSAPDKDIQRGQKIGEDPNAKKSNQQESGNKPGEEYYEIELTLEELADYLFADLELPDLERKKISRVFAERLKRHGYRPEGIRPRLDKKRSLKNLVKRRVASSRVDESADTSGDISFHEKDLVYKHMKPKDKESSNAVIFFLMDISGSMTKLKKYLARSFYFLLYHFLRGKYEHVEIVFIAHDTSAYEVNEDQFFKRGNSGGTLVSTGLQMVSDVIEKRFHPSNWNIYCFQCSDGDNWSEDTPKTMALIDKLKGICQLFGYCEIRPPGEVFNWEKASQTVLWNTYVPLENRNLKMVTINTKEDIWESFKRLFSRSSTSQSRSSLKKKARVSK